MNLYDMETILGPSGILSEKVPFFEYRPQQLDLASRIWDNLQNSEDRILAFEAPTGLGKTFAVLVPSILWALREQKKILFLTAAIPLQEQLYFRDIPQILNAMDQKLTYGLLKGRNNYGCIRRAESLFSEGFLSFDDDGQASQKIQSWIAQTKTGDMTEIPLPPEHPVRGLIAATQKKCLGYHCPQRRDCFITRMLNRSKSWDLAVANYHLYLAYVLGGKNEFPFFPDVIICDEAHRIDEATRSVSTIAVSRESFESIFSSYNHSLLKQVMEKNGYESSEIGERYSECLNLSQTFFDMVNIKLGNGASYSGLDEGVRDIYRRYMGESASLRNRLNPLRSKIKDSQNLEEDQQELRFLSWCDELDETEAELSFCSQVEHYPDWAYWKERTTLYAAPTKVSPLLSKAKLFTSGKVIALSATLTVDSSFSFWSRETGILPEVKGIYDTPFDLESQMEIWVADLGMNVIDSSYDDYISKVIKFFTDKNGGHTMVLVSSKRLLGKVASHFRKNNPAYHVLVQGDLPRRELLDLFRTNDSSVLIGTVSFREGVDIPGDRLTQVIIDRIPFPHPNDPVVQARKDLEGRSAFVKVTLPRAKMSLKQAAGRLIRSKNDIGKVVILDGRVLSRKHWCVLESLPRVKVRMITLKNGAVAR